MKKIVVIGLVILFGLTVWYLFIKKNDYHITFNINAAPGSVYHQVKTPRYLDDASINQEVRIIDTELFRSIKQEVTIRDEKVILNWNFKSINDTITKIKVGIISKNHSLKNRLKIVVGSSSLVKLIKEDLINFRKDLREYTNTFKVVVDGEADIPAMQTLSISSKTRRFGKAGEMMAHNSHLHPKLIKRNIQKNGFPYLKIKNWDQVKDSIYLDFGFPIVPQDSLPVNSKIAFSKIASQKALKATYYGDYRSSDEAWFVLLEYAAKNNIEVEPKPIEFFYNDPMMAINELEWKAEIYLPIKTYN